MNRLACRFVIFLLSLCLALPASAATTEIRALLDLDDDVATGCTVVTVDGPFAGVEMIHTTTVDTTGGLPTVTSIDRSSCVDPGTGTFGPALAIVAPYPPPIAVGIGNGVGGAFVVESYLPLTGVPAGGIVHVGFDTGSPTTGPQDALLSDGGNPITITVGAAGAADIPTVGEWGLILLGILLVISAMVLMRERPETRTLMMIVMLLGGATIAYAAGFVPDGAIGDWTGEPMLAQDATGDASSADLSAVFAGVESNILFLRYDMANFANSDPVANDQTVATAQDTPVAITLTGSDPDADPLTFAIATSPANGVLSGTAPNATYTPNAGFVGNDSFTFTVNDGTVDSAPATVTITVTDTNEAPVVSDQTFGVAENSANGTVVGTVVASDPDAGQTLSYAITGGTGQTAFAIDALTGEITVADAAQLDFETSASFTLTVEVSDDGTVPLSTSATMTIDLADVDEAPVATADAYATDEDVILNVAAPGVLGNDFDPEGGALTAVLDVDVSNGVLTLNADGSFIYTPNADFSGADSFSYHANDGTADSSTVTVSITIGAVDDPPVAVDDAYATDEDTVLNVVAPGVLGNDSDAEGQTITVTAFDATSASGASVTVNADGSFSYDPTGAAALQALDDAESVGDTFTYTVSDGTSTDAATVTVTVTGANDAPVATADAYVTDEDVALVVAAPGVLANDTDVDVEPLTAVLDTDVVNGILTLNPDGSFTYTPETDFNGTEVFSYHANDGTADSSTVIVTITVNPVNDPPIALADSYSGAGNVAAGNTQFAAGGATPTAVASVSSALSIATNDSDPDAGDTLTYSVASATTTEGGTVVMNADGSFLYTPPSNPAIGSDTFTYTVTDTGGLMGTATVTLTIEDFVWYVDNSNATAPFNGTSTDPFQTLPQADAASAANQTIYVFQGDSGTTPYAAGIQLKDGQKLFGQAVDLVVTLSATPVTLVTGNPANTPVVRADHTNVLVDSTGGAHQNIQVRGFDLGNNDVEDTVLVTEAGNPVSISLSDLTISTVNTGGAAAGIRFDGSGGSTLHVMEMQNIVVTQGGTAVSGIVATDTVFDANPADPDFTGDTVSGGTITIGSSGARLGGTGLSLQNVSGDLSIADLDVFTSGATGVDLTGSGSFNAGAGTGFRFGTSAGTLDAVTGTALSGSTATLAMVLDAVSSANAIADGFILNNMGGTLSVTGTTTVTGAGGDGIEILSSSLAPTFATVAIDDVTGRGVLLTGNSGVVTINGGSIGEIASTPTTTGGNAVDIDTQTANVTIAAAIANSANRSVEVTNSGNGATILFSGAIDDDGTGIFLDNNDVTSNATVSFTGGLDLDTTTSTAFTATNGGIVAVDSGAVSTTADTTTGTVVQIENTTIGGSGVTFDSTSSTGGTDGIILTSTSGGPFTSLGGSIADQTFRGVDISGGSGDVAIASSVSSTSTGRSVEVNDRTGGTITFSGLVDDNGLGVSLSANGATAINFTGGLDIDTVGANTGLNATTGGVITATGTNNINTTAGTGTGLNLSGTTIGAGGMTFAGVSTDGANGILIDTVGGGALTINGGSISAATTRGVDINALSSNFTYAGTIANSGGRTVEVTNSGGNPANTITFGGLVDENGVGINLDNNDANSGATITFSGGLDIDTGTNTGFNAVNGGTVQATQNNTTILNSVNTTTGTAINIQNTTIGASGVTFRSVSVNGLGTSVNPGINLGSTGGGNFAVAGSGSTNGSGGTIQDVLEDGVRLNNTNGVVSLSNMIVEDIGNMAAASPGHHGIDGQQVNGGLVLDNVTIQRVSDSAIHGEAPGGGSTTWSGLQVTNSTLAFSNRFHVANVADGGGADEAMITIEGISGTVAINSNDFDWGPGFVNLFTANSGTVDITVQGNTFNDGRKDLAGVASVGSSGVRVNTTGTINAAIRIGDPAEASAALGNVFVDTGSDAAIIVSGFTSSDNSNVDVVISRNSITVNDHTSPPGLCTTLATCAFDFPNGGIGIESRGSGTFEAIVSQNTLVETQNSGGLSTGSLRVDVSGTNTEVIVRNNTITRAWDGPLFIRADDTDGNGARGFLLIRDNVHQSGPIGEPGSGDDLDAHSLANSPSPFLPNRFQVRNGAILDLTVINDDMVSHDPFNSQFDSLDMRINGDAVGGTSSIFNVLIQNTEGPEGFRFRNDDDGGDGTASEMNLSRGLSLDAAATDINAAQAQSVLDDNGNTTGGVGTSADVPFNGVNIVTTTPTLPVVVAP